MIGNLKVDKVLFPAWPEKLSAGGCRETGRRRRNLDFIPVENNKANQATVQTKTIHCAYPSWNDMPSFSIPGLEYRYPQGERSSWIKVGKCSQYLTIWAVPNRVLSVSSSAGPQKKALKPKMASNVKAIASRSVFRPELRYPIIAMYATITA
jgi:hypothetical protein